VTAVGVTALAANAILHDEILGILAN